MAADPFHQEGQTDLLVIFTILGMHLKIYMWKRHLYNKVCVFVVLLCVFVLSRVYLLYLMCICCTSYVYLLYSYVYLFYLVCICCISCVFVVFLCVFVVLLMCICCSSYVYLLYFLCVFVVLLMCICCTVCIAVLTLDAGLPARSQYPEGPVTGHLDTGFSWFPSVYKQKLRWFPSFQVATTCLSCSPPGLNSLVTFFHICVHVI